MPYESLVGGEILRGLNNPGADWVKLEVLADTRTLLPDPIATVEALERLVKDGFQVLCYTSDDPITSTQAQAGRCNFSDACGSPSAAARGF